MYKPNQRKVKVDVLAVSGWVSGTLHVPGKSSLVSALNKKCQFLPLTDVTTEEGCPPIDFLALRRDAILLVLPDAAAPDLHSVNPPGSYVDMGMRCMLEQATVSGTTQVLGGLRLSDFLETNPGFIVLARCALDKHDGESVADIGHVVVNTAHVLAVTEMETEKRSKPELVGAGALVGASSR